MNTDPVAAKIVNDQIRPMCDVIAGTTARLALILQQGQAQDWLQYFPANDDLVADGSPDDGRKPVTNNQIRAIIAATFAYVEYMNTPAPVLAPVQLALLAAVNPRL